MRSISLIIDELVTAALLQDISLDSILSDVEAAYLEEEWG
jgi:hypothetical protein